MGFLFQLSRELLVCVEFHLQLVLVAAIHDGTQLTVFDCNLIDKDSLSVLGQSRLLFVDIIPFPWAHHLTVAELDLARWQDFSLLDVEFAEHLFACFPGSLDLNSGLFLDGAHRLNSKGLFCCRSRLLNDREILGRGTIFAIHDLEGTLSLVFFIFAFIDNITLFFFDLFRIHALHVAVFPAAIFISTVITLLLLFRSFVFNHQLIIILDQKWVILVGFGEIVEVNVLFLVHHVHLAVLLIQHVLLASDGVFELLRAAEAELTDLDSLSHICKHALEVNQTVDVKENEGMLEPHVIKAFLEAVEFLVAKQAAPQGLEGGLPP